MEGMSYKEYLKASYAAARLLTGVEGKDLMMGAWLCIFISGADAAKRRCLVRSKL
jgi:hypothetical protein